MFVQPANVAANIMQQTTTSQENTKGNTSFRQMLLGTNASSEGQSLLQTMNQQNQASIRKFLQQASHEDVQSILKNFSQALSPEVSKDRMTQLFNEMGISLNEKELQLIVESMSENTQNVQSELQNMTTDELQTIIGKLSQAAQNQLSDQEKNQLLSELTSIGENEKLDLNQLFQPFDQSWLQILQSSSTSSSSDTSNVKEEAQSLWNQVKSLLQKLQSNGSSKDMKQLLNVLQQWTQLAKSDGQALASVMQSIPNQQSKAVWQKLLENYQSRASVSNQYQSPTKVTQQDLSRWLQHALDNQDVSLKQEMTQTRSDSTLMMNQQPTSKVQQYVMHVQQTNQTQEVNQKQMLDQFQQILKSSQFMKTANGSNQLSIRMQPENLGNMTVRFTQINGEMAVKMIVSSQAAKEMLEGNMAQLRHMFSPHQVVVEKQDMTTTFSSQQKLADDNNPSDSDTQSQEQEDWEENENDDEQQEETSFFDLLMDQKV
ncbi:hypothetical protein J416_00784 [Gracilibacillus halophilus YIM-C55.5]|uniref:Flagellar hook-length control protein-like C-terminal domain-containing protein n=1 Tax=Gracilibacillus halophilus YIM-C55.5 TaxID=1308866 RepID=N4WYV7_9BACI|nr:flagellar hook-length control protein FliK [Gracilibacillus halophilus]ENH98236.1 hypothetical protein J416_00784 [Gracilibacillus halophilus YIM-C55.5]